MSDIAGAAAVLRRDQLTWQCEQAVRNHDPRISCSTHFLDLRVRDRTAEPG